MMKSIAYSTMALVFAATAFAADKAAKTASVTPSRKELKEACLKENPSLKGKELTACIKGKKAAAATTAPQS